MEYNILHLSKDTLKDSLYFLDANLWLKILKPKFDLNKKDEQYLAYFRKFSPDLSTAKIVVTTMLLSEVINRYIKDVSFRKYCKKNGVTESPSYYKQVYRISEQFNSDLTSLTDDISLFSDRIKIVDDGFGNDIQLNDAISYSGKQLDFNDNYAFKLCVKRNYVVVTDDQDFFVPGVKVLTLNNQLLEKAKSSVKPKQS